MSYPSKRRNVAASGTNRRKHPPAVKIWVIFSLLVTAAELITAFAGDINPNTFTLPAIAAMAFPLFFLAMVIVGIVNFFVCRRAVTIQGVALLLSLGAFWDFCPLNIIPAHISDSDSTLLVNFMTYNTYGFEDNEGIYPDNTNRTASTIINSGADIICLQEVGDLLDLPGRHLYNEQIDSINDEYPYFTSDTHKNVSILSRYPLKELELPQPEKPYNGWVAAEAKINSDTVLVVSVHLQSIGLNNDDKLIFHEMTDGSRSLDWSEATTTLYSKLAWAFRQRALQADMLAAQIDSLGYRNVLLSGDFNDVAMCYAINRLRHLGLKLGYSRIGLGPRITYHADRFYFNIDHVLFRGDIRITSMHLGKIKSSDHYPVYATFIIGRRK